VEETEWHRVVLFDRQAEIAGKFLAKGSLAYVEGRLRTRKWEDKDGTPRFTTEVVGDQLVLLSRKDDDGGGQQGQAEPHPPAARPPAPTSAPSAQSRSSFDSMDDDIPF